VIRSFRFLLVPDLFLRIGNGGPAAGVAHKTLREDLERMIVGMLGE
jgi:hypothetical protein